MHKHISTQYIAALQPAMRIIHDDPHVRTQKSFNAGAHAHPPPHTHHKQHPSPACANTHLNCNLTGPTAGCMAEQQRHIHTLYLRTPHSPGLQLGQARCWVHCRAAEMHTHTLPAHTTLTWTATWPGPLLGALQGSRDALGPIGPPALQPPSLLLL
eukprot:588377-Pelagomonas_calceolata.AAC.4